MEKVNKSAESKMKKTVHSFEEELNTVRTGRASAALFEKIQVEYYGQKVPLNQVATISVPEARLVVIQPWDKAVLSEIEKAIQKSELSVNPNNDGKVIRINIPPLTEERRKELVKVTKNMAEHTSVAGAVIIIAIEPVLVCIVWLLMLLLSDFKILLNVLNKARFDINR